MIRRPAALEALLVTGGRIAFVGFWFVAVMLVYRGLGQGPEGLAQAGQFAVAIAAVKIASGVVSDPLDLAVMRRVPPLLREAPERAWEVLRAAFGLRFAAVAVMAATGAALAPWLAELVLHDPAAAPVLRLAALAALGDAVFRAVLVVLQAQERFRRFVMVEALLQLGRFVSILLLWAAGGMDVARVLAFYAAIPWLAAAAGMLALPRPLLRGWRVRRDDLLDLVHYLKWVVPAMVLAALNERLDIFLVTLFRGPDEAGLYGAMITLALVPDIIAGCLSTLLQPRIVAMQSGGRFPVQLRRFLMASLPVCALGFVVALAVSGPVIGWVLGPRYLPALPAFHWLLAGTLFWLAVTPLPLTLVAVQAPRRLALLTVVQSGIVLAGGLLLLPRLGLVGMAQAVFVMRASVALLVLLLARRMVAPMVAPAEDAVPPRAVPLR
ncbi:oligosaccharide flippase family protein [Roseomonas sp. OT10]|uniref:lipopolysaccharide biosynthesis protein n=1 Tax=Roseomonas cutis TaxID=2897332 RepID=UPI001E2DA0E0|nr:oligosaccharide flippase family protein [Roseomonas sp. OT10]UFN49759.1 oligosaccharide flippase family protein [Roseomonas sp. OT10]